MIQGCTVISTRQLAHARVLCDSFRALHPDASFTVVVTDDVRGLVKSEGEPFEVVPINELAGAPLDGPTERPGAFAAACAGLLMRTLSSRGSAHWTVFLGPATRVFAALEALDEVACGQRLVTFGHPPACVIAARHDGDDVLERWTLDALKGDGSGPNEGRVIGNGEWVADISAPALALGGTGGRPTVGGHRLKVAGFGRIALATPDSTAWSDAMHDSDPLAAELCRRYRAALDRRGYREVGGLAYGRGPLAAAGLLGQVLRGLHDEAVADDWPEVGLSDERVETFLQWCAELHEPSGLSRFLYAVWESRPDVRDAYPALDEEGRAGLAAWAWNTGRHEVPILDRLMPPRPDATEPPARTMALPPPAGDPGPSDSPTQPAVRGINVVGFLSGGLGLGEAARLSIACLDAANVPLIPIDASGPVTARADVQLPSARPEGAGFDVNLLCLNGDFLPAFAAEAGSEFFRGRYSIGLWFWELARFPEEWREAVETLDEIWVSSRHMRDALAPASPVPVSWVSLGVEFTPAVPFERSHYRVRSGDFTFGYMFDYNSTIARKNPLGLIAAFESTFDADAGAALVIKTVGSEACRDDAARVHLAASRHPNVHIIDGYLPRRDKDELMAGLDCYVSLHRSEGFALTIAEAMWRGKPVIATSYGGNMDYMTPGNSYPVGYKTVPVGEDGGLYPADGHWAEPDLNEAAALMREVFADREGTAAKGARAARHIRHSHSFEKAGDDMVRHLEVIWRKHGRRRGKPSEESAAIQRLAAGIQAGPPRPSRSRLGPLGQVARKVILRLMWPYTTHQRAVDDQFVALLGEINEKIDNISTSEAEHLTLLRAQILAELRRMRRGLDQRGRQE